MFAYRSKYINFIITMMTGLLIASLSLFASTAWAEKLEDKSNLSWVSLKGTVVEQQEDSFTLDYGESTVTVEVDDWERYEEGELIMNGDQVTVYGMVDKDFYHKKIIEADSIYVNDLNTVLTDPSSTDEEDPAPSLYNHYIGPIDYDFEVSGTVTSTSGREFTIDTGERQVTVDTLLMPYNPMDDKGFQQVEEGDLVRVSGDLDLSVFEDREVIAESVVTLS